MSLCCGQKAYNPLNEICCNSTLHDRSSPTTNCCDEEIYDTNSEMCCGIHGEKKILKRLSFDHRCCLTGQYNTKLECCCPDQIPMVQLKSRNDSSTKSCTCEKNLELEIPSSTCFNDTTKCPCCPDGVSNSSRPHGCPLESQVCCTSWVQAEIYLKKNGFQCCGHYYFNESLWFCSEGRLILVQRPDPNQDPKASNDTG